MTRSAIFAATIALSIARSASAFPFIVDEQLYPATITAIATSDVDISNGISFFSQSDSPRGLNMFSTTLFSVPAGVPTNVGTVLNGPPPFGVYKSYSSQHELFLGTYEENGSTGIVALLKEGVGVGQAFEEVFPGYDPNDVVTALLGLSSGDNSAFSLLGALAADSLAAQPEYRPESAPPDFFLLEQGVLVKFSSAAVVSEVGSLFEVTPFATFSNGVAAGTVEGSYQITGGPFANSVPEPSGLMLGVIGLAGMIAASRYRRIA